jgi:arginine-tRNA-protein transferase
MFQKKALSCRISFMKIQGVHLGNFETGCPYLPDRRFTSEDMVVADIDEQGLDYLLSLGFRHFGSHFFRPVCKTCHQCIPIRVPVESFEPSRNMRRVLKKASSLTTEIRGPEATEEKYRLYLSHLNRFPVVERSGYESFREAFFTPLPFSRELDIFDGEELVAVAHFDLTATLLSAVYCYWNPKRESLGLGTLAILKEMEYARNRGLRHVYLGYYVPESRHMNYKARFQPNEILLREGAWVAFSDRGGETPLPGPDGMGFIPVTRIVPE